MYTSVQPKHLSAARLLVKPVNILSDHRLQFSLLLHLSQLLVGCIRLCIQAEHFIMVKTVKFLRVIQIEGMA